MWNRIKDKLGLWAGEALFKLIEAFEFCVDNLFAVIVVLSCGILALTIVIECGSTPIEKCGTVTRVGGCGNSVCRAELDRSYVLNTTRLVIEGEEYCWQTGRTWR